MLQGFGLTSSTTLSKSSQNKSILRLAKEVCLSYHREDQDKCGDHYSIGHGHEGQEAPDLTFFPGIDHRAVQMGWGT